MKDYLKNRKFDYDNKEFCASKCPFFKVPEYYQDPHECDLYCETLNKKDNWIGESLGHARCKKCMQNVTPSTQRGVMKKLISIEKKLDILLSRR